ncbi:MAG: hypothetical protein PHY47_26430, partial [Lachnospiraceae bacterium]|nr:hypothetical protein [Lachnospiraceae bacterium]
MYVKAHCPVCGTDVYHNVRLHALEYLNFEGEGEGQACRYVVENVEVTGSFTEDEMIGDVLRGLQGVITDGI